MRYVNFESLSNFLGKQSWVKCYKIMQHEFFYFWDFKNNLLKLFICFSSESCHFCVLSPLIITSKKIIYLQHHHIPHLSIPETQEATNQNTFFFLKKKKFLWVLEFIEVNHSKHLEMRRTLLTEHHRSILEMTQSQVWWVAAENLFQE